MQSKWDYESLATDLGVALEAAPDGLDISEIMAKLKVPPYVAYKIIRKARLDLAGGDSMAIAIRRDEDEDKDARRQIYFLSGEYEEVGTWEHTRLNTVAARTLVDVASIEAIKHNYDGRSAKGKALRRALSDLSHARESVDIALEELGVNSHKS